LEFLLTYGWAIMASLVAVGALVYFGISSPSNYLPDKCIFSNNFGCSDYIMNSPNLAKVRLVNGIGQSIYNISATASLTSSGTTYACVVISSQWFTNDIRDVNCTLGGGTSWSAKSKAKVYITVIYRTDPAGYNQNAVGELYSTVQ